ncbi:MAG: pyrimidine 5'-nucleotidase [Chloroflexi bacterium]|jgi:putative hydrolase of the HAD superfamily|nr:pyrimidine 5'-nucleotidase [Chloroflexota bacterium]
MQNSITTLFIDLDGTVYNRNNGMLAEMSHRIALFMEKIMHLSPAAIPALIDRYYHTYGSTLRGIQQEHDVDARQYLEFVHDLELDHYLQPDRALYQSLASIPLPKWIFTNSSRSHAERVLAALGIADLFDGILDVWTMEYIPKPHPWVYHHALEMAGDPDPWNCAFIDDSACNLPPANRIGFSTIWVGEGHNTTAASLSIPRLHQLPQALELLEQDLLLPPVFYPAPLLEPAL